MKTALLALATLLLAACGPDFEDGSFPPLDEAAVTSGSETTSLKGTRPEVRPLPTPLAQHAVRTTTAHSSRPRWQDSFSLQNTSDVFVAFDFEALAPGPHSLSVFFYAPGFPYERKDLTFTIGGPPGPDDVQVETVAPGLHRVWTRLLVSGTLVEQFWLIGAWQVTGHLDGSQQATATADFTIW